MHMLCEHNQVPHACRPLQQEPLEFELKHFCWCLSIDKTQTLGLYDLTAVCDWRFMAKKKDILWLKIYGKEKDI